MSRLPCEICKDNSCLDSLILINESRFFWKIGSGLDNGITSWHVTDTNIGLCYLHKGKTIYYPPPARIVQGFYWLSFTTGRPIEFSKVFEDVNNEIKDFLIFNLDVFAGKK